MTPNDRERFALLIADVLGFYGQTPSKFALTVWWQACQPFEFEAVQRALGRHAMDPEVGQFAPKPADLVRQMQGTPTDRAAKAWGMVIDAASKVGAYADVAFDDPIIHAVVMDLGGWPVLCRTNTDELGYLRHRFTEGYRAYARRGDLQNWPRQLCGDRSPDETYLARGLQPPRPVLVGDAAAAARVMAGGSEAGRYRIATLDDAVTSAVASIGIESREDAA